MITRHFGIPVTSPGAILRRERDLGKPLGQETAEALRSGGLVSDKIIIGLIEDWLRLHGGHGFVFDGFPRSLPLSLIFLSFLSNFRSALFLVFFLFFSYASFFSLLPVRLPFVFCFFLTISSLS